jgi:hypothetical protein
MQDEGKNRSKSNNEAATLSGIFSFFYIFSASILQKYMVRKKICKTIHLASWGTAAVTYRRAPRH